MDARDQKLVDQALVTLDGTPDKSRLGANAMLGASLESLKTRARKIGRLLRSADIPARGRATRAALGGGTEMTNACDLRLASENAVFGTPEYMSPEQARGEDAIAGSDLYALGILFFEMLTGRRAFGGDTMTERVSEPNDAFAEAGDDEAPF